MARELYSTSLFNDANLVSYYRLEGNANDSKGSNNGTPTDVTFGLSYGKFGQGANFNGTSSIITIPKNASLNLSNNWTISYWASPYDTTNLKMLFSNGLGDVVQGGVFGYNVGVITIRTSADSFNADAGMTTGWHMYTFTFSNGNTLKAYKDGQLITTTAVSGTITSWGSSGDMYFGKLVGNYYYYKGYADDIAIFNRALSATEIETLYRVAGIFFHNFL